MVLVKNLFFPRPRYPARLFVAAVPRLGHGRFLGEYRRRREFFAVQRRFVALLDIPRPGLRFPLPPEFVAEAIPERVAGVIHAGRNFRQRVRVIRLLVHIRMDIRGCGCGCDADTPDRETEHLRSRRRIRRHSLSPYIQIPARSSPPG